MDSPPLPFYPSNKGFGCSVRAGSNFLLSCLEDKCGAHNDMFSTICSSPLLLLDLGIHNLLTQGMKENILLRFPFHLSHSPNSGADSYGPHHLHKLFCQCVKEFNFFQPHLTLLISPTVPTILTRTGEGKITLTLIKALEENSEAEMSIGKYAASVSRTKSNSPI